MSERDGNTAKEGIDMKLKLKLFGIAALVAIIGFSIVGCKETERNDPKTITITGVSAYSGSDADIRIFSVYTGTDEGNVKVAYGDATISGSSNI